MLRSIAARARRSSSAAATKHPRIVLTSVPNKTTKPRVVVLGSGWGGNKVARAVDKNLFDVHVVSPANHFLFTPLLPSTAVGTLEFRAVQEPIRTIPGLGQYYQAKAREIDVEKRTVRCQGMFRRECFFDVPYDFLVVAAGCKTNTFGTPGVVESNSVHFLKHLYHARRIRARILECFERAASPLVTDEKERAALVRFVAVGGGATSCEFATELADLLERDLRKWYPDIAKLASLVLVEAGPNILGGFDDACISYYTKHLKKHGVEVRTCEAVAEVASNPDGGVSTATLARRDGSDSTETLEFGCLVWSAGLAPVKFVDKSNLETGPHGRVLIDEYLRAADRVFALGDCAADKNAPLPPTASSAEQQGAYLAKCLNQSYATCGPEDALSVPEPVTPTAMPNDLLAPFDAFWDAKSEFRYVERGKMASMGMWGGVADLTQLPGGGGTLQGVTAFAAWRGAYLSKQVSVANMILIPMFWFKSWLFGRDISRF
mmetsp:Transcript_9876/g.29657  ORF Transcript_9876/g.29657 Transcript_9876/m.29657 type:complete len:490 (+) Transcript_9876:939-2408(+)